MLSRPISRRHVLKLSVVTMICFVASDVVSAGQFQYKPSSEVNWPKYIIRSVQSRLKELGFDPSTIDGIYGSKTKNAIIEYQRTKGLEVDGKISNKLIRELKLG